MGFTRVPMSSSCAKRGKDWHVVWKQLIGHVKSGHSPVMQILEKGASRESLFDALDRQNLFNLGHF